MATKKSIASLLHWESAEQGSFYPYSKEFFVALSCFQVTRSFPGENLTLFLLSWQNLHSSMNAVRVVI